MTTEENGTGTTTYLYGGRMDRDSTRGILTLQSSIDDDDIWTTLFVECKGETETGGTCTDDEDLSEMRQRHCRGMREGSEATS